MTSSIYKRLKAQKLVLAVAESCTGGLVSAAITAIPGSSDYFDRGFVTYSNEAKHEMLGVKLALIKKFGAVSEQVAKAMAEGALKNSNADVSIAVTGIAGPDGGTAKKPVGTVCFAIARRKFKAQTETHHFSGNREAVRAQAVEWALNLL